MKKEPLKQDSWNWNQSSKTAPAAKTFALKPTTIKRIASTFDLLSL
jgi:hypothetical protein